MKLRSNPSRARGSHPETFRKNTSASITSPGRSHTPPPLAHTARTHHHLCRSHLRHPHSSNCSSGSDAPCCAYRSGSSCWARRSCRGRATASTPRRCAASAPSAPSCWPCCDGTQHSAARCGSSAADAMRSSRAPRPPARHRLAGYGGLELAWGDAAPLASPESGGQKHATTCSSQS